VATPISPQLSSLSKTKYSNSKKQSCLTNSLHKKSSLIYHNHYSQNSLHEFIKTLSIYDYKHIIENFDCQEMYHTLVNHMPKITFNSNGIQLIRLNNNQFTSILHLLLEDIILIFRRCKEAFKHNLLEIDFSCPPFCSSIFHLINFIHKSNLSSTSLVYNFFQIIF
jgi:hypothetical protein